MPTDTARSGLPMLFRRHGIELIKSPHDRGALYLNMLPALNAGQVKLLDLPRIRSQLLALERKTIRASGRDVVDHPTAGHDDLINVVAGALVMAAAGSRYVRFSALGTLSDGGVVDGKYVSAVPSGAPPEVREATEEYWTLSPEDQSRRRMLGPNWRSRIPTWDPSYRAEGTVS
jgi:hypothetical protein